jgi:alpha-glucosidase
MSEDHRVATGSEREHVPADAPPGAQGAAADVADALQPEWWKTGVVYQIYPRSFADTNGDGLGDLAGIIEHLDHLKGTPDSLGVDAIWLSPIYPSPDFDFGYDVADYVGIDPRFGTLDDFARLIDAAHTRGLRVILDLVLNHTSHLHPWFQASRTDRDGPFGDWYLWRDPAPDSPPGRRARPNNWRSFFGGPGWTWDEVRGQYYFHTFLSEQPDLNWRHPGVRAAIVDVVRTWLDRGVDGFRLDVFNTFFKDAELRANPRRPGPDPWSRQRHVFDRNQPELVEFLAELRAVVDEQPGRMTVGELFDGTATEAVAYVAPRHLVFDWAVMNLPWDAGAFRRAIAVREAVFGPDRWPANALSNHDQPRHASRYDEPAAGGAPGAALGDDVGDVRAKVAAAALLTMRGTPFLYYGEEVAQRDIHVPRATAFDPFARRADPGRSVFNRDECRGPIAWTGDPPGFGFSDGLPWLPMSADSMARNVAGQAADPDSILSWYRRLLALRRESPALQRGDQELVDVDDPDVLAYLRIDGPGGERVFVALNFANREAALAIPPPAAGGRHWRVALSSAPSRGRVALEGGVVLAPLEALVAVEA